MQSRVCSIYKVFTPCGLVPARPSTGPPTGRPLGGTLLPARPSALPLQAIDFHLHLLASRGSGPTALLPPDQHRPPSWAAVLAMADRYGLRRLRLLAAQKALRLLMDSSNPAVALTAFSGLSGATYQLLFEATAGVAHASRGACCQKCGHVHRDPAALSSYLPRSFARSLHRLSAGLKGASGSCHRR